LHTKIPLKCILSSSYHYSSTKDGPSSDAPKLDYIIAVDHLTNSGILTILIIDFKKKNYKYYYIIIIIIIIKYILTYIYINYYYYLLTFLIKLF